MTHEKIPLAGVIGSPVAHSLSPKLHRYWLKHYNIPGFYIPMDVAGDDLETVLRTMPKMGFKGVNITIPHKEQAIEIADKVTDRASLIGAANTLTFTDDESIVADNTDGFGFIQNIYSTHGDWNPKAGPALVLGAGGAARAVISSLLEAGVPEIFLSNRTRVRAEMLKQAMGKLVTVIEWARCDEKMSEVSTVVNTTSLGMEGNAPLPFTLTHLSSDALVTDIVYTPLDTPFLLTARERGCRTVDGLGMLLYQAVPGFDRWFGKKPEVTVEMRQAILSK